MLVLLESIFKTICTSRHDEWVAADLLQKYTEEDPQKPLVQGGSSEKNPRPSRKNKTGKATG